MTNTPEVLVLVADDKRGVICASTCGVSRPLVSLDAEAVAGGGPGCGDVAPGCGRRAFARALMEALDAQLHVHPCDGVAILAGGELMKDLRRFRTREVLRHLFAEIVERSVSLAGLGAPEWRAA